MVGWSALKRLAYIEYVLIVSFAALIAFHILYILRFMDDNTLASWRWIFRGISLWKNFLYLLAALAVASGLSVAATPGRKGCIPFVALSSFFVIIPLWSIPEVFLDTARYFTYAKTLELHGVAYFLAGWGRVFDVWTDMPLVPLVHGLVFSHAGESRLYIQIFNTLLFSLAAVLTSLAGKELWDGERGFHAGILLLAMPYLLVQVPMMMTDVPAMFMTALMLYLVIMAARTGGMLHLVAAGISVFLSLMTRYSLWPVSLITLILVCISGTREHGWRAVSRTGLVACIGVIPMLAVASARFDVFSGQFLILRDYQWRALDVWSESFFSSFLFQMHPFLCIFAVAGAGIALMKRDTRFLIPLGFAVFIIFFGYGRMRYLVPMFPFFALMSAYGLHLIPMGRVRSFTVYVMVLFSLAVLYSGYMPFLMQTSMVNLQRAGRYLNGLAAPAVGVITLPQEQSAASTDVAVPILDLYAHKRLVYLEGEDEAAPGDGDDSLYSLRFAREFRVSSFYRPDRTHMDMPLVVISGMGDGPPPELELAGSVLRKTKDFCSATGVFRYRTFVHVYE